MQKNLRERGIYQLPDKREFVVCTNPNKAYILFTLSAWHYRGCAEYFIRNDGRLLSKGLPTRWSIKDLADTGRTMEGRQS